MARILGEMLALFALSRMVEVKQAPAKKKTTLSYHPYQHPSHACVRSPQKKHKMQLTGCWQSSMHTPDVAENPQSDLQKRRQSPARTVHVGVEGEETLG